MMVLQALQLPGKYMAGIVAVGLTQFLGHVVVLLSSLVQEAMLAREKQHTSQRS